MSKYPELSAFSIAFADAYRGFMKEYRITGQALTEKLNRALGYVSERVNGKRALDTEDVDALAMLAGDGWTGRTLMIELARRAKKAMEDEASLAQVVDLKGRMNGESVSSTGEDVETPVDDEKAAASKYSDDRGEDDGYDA